MNLSFSAKSQSGFTLLEVLISITLTAMVLGSLLALKSQNMQLNYRIQNKLNDLYAEKVALRIVQLDLSEPSLDDYQKTRETPAEKQIEKESKIKEIWKIVEYSLIDRDKNIIAKSARLEPKDK